MKIVLIFPNQLFENNKCLDKIHKTKDVVILAEDYLFFRHFKFHKQKLALHRASMKFYADYLVDLGYKVKYLESERLTSRKSLGELLKNEVPGLKKIVCYEPIDYWLETDLSSFSKSQGVELEYVDSPMFLNTRTENRKYFTKPDGSFKKPFMKTFYEWQRNRLNILMLDKNTPVGGKYSFDTENRKKLPNNYLEPEGIQFKEDEYLLEAREYVEKNFSDNYGSLEKFNYATNFKDAKKVLQNFLENKFQNFGIYEDSISSKYNNINHSVLTPYLNTGLLTPSFVVKQTLKFAKNNSKEIPLNSLEGLLRQIIGWREFMRAMYDIFGNKMRTNNFFEHKKELGEEFWTASTGNQVVDNTIKKTHDTAYNHHIERLMILGNYMLLSEYDPESVYKWFMEMYIDSYDWVMVPNVYGMSQFADGGIFATKPYISSSNYILKMSDYKKDGIWNKEFDDKFWAFLKKHRDFFSKNIRFKMLLGNLDKKQ